MSTSTTVNSVVIQVQEFVKYWNLETPVVMDTEKNEIRFYKNFGKIQVYPKISVGRGIGRGSTINLDTMSPEEMDKFFLQVEQMMDKATTTPLPSGTKYWDEEDAKVFETEKNEIRFFYESGKIQVYPRLDSGKIGKGGTINIDHFNTKEREVFLSHIDEVVTHLVENGITPPSAPPEKVKPKVPENLDLSTPWWLTPASQAPKKVEDKISKFLPTVNDNTELKRRIEEFNKKAVEMNKTQFITEGLKHLFTAEKFDEIYIDSIGGSKKEVTTALKEDYGKSRRSGAGPERISYDCKAKGITLRVPGRTEELTWSQLVNFVTENINTLRISENKYELSDDISEEEMDMYGDNEEENIEVPSNEVNVEVNKEKSPIEVSILSDDELKKQYIAAIDPEGPLWNSKTMRSLHDEMKMRKIL